MASVSIVYPVQDLTRDLEFLVERGFEKRFVDGDAFALLVLGSVRLMAVAGNERIVEQPSLAFQIGDSEAGELLSRYPEARVIEGGHERNIVIQDPAGNTVVFFVRKPAEEER